jgi:hypothetical protein
MSDRRGHGAAWLHDTWLHAGVLRDGAVLLKLATNKTRSIIVMRGVQYKKPSAWI